MKWDDYYRRYRAFALAMQETNLVAVVASKALASFPASLPSEWRATVVTTFRNLGEALNDAVKQLKGDSAVNESPEQRSVTNSVEGNVEGPHSDVATASVLFMLHGSLAGLPAGSYDFRSVAYSQHLTMSLAHPNAFVADSVRAICYARPNVLKSDRKLEWKAIIDAGEWSAVFSRLVEDFVYSFGWESIKECTLAMRNRFGLAINVDDAALERINQAELIRNVVIHDGGRVNGEYLKRSGRTDVSMGEQLLVDAPFTNGLSHDMMHLAGEILLDVSEVHFGIKRDSITGVPRHERVLVPDEKDSVSSADAEVWQRHNDNEPGAT